ncbi:MAG: MmgE/PrpD family protein [Betaproteobacteria bacterium]|nr:MmgE/PrpD family protein [Betaproteobacteria bacterium]MDH5220227.1 MmgE/PrpD family protein [Betaproteobacteria bacterium]
MATVLERFADWAVAFRAQPLASEVVHHARRAVIDLHAAMISGAVEAPATLLERALAEELDRGEARLALGRRAAVRAAGLINGAAAHTTEVDDIFRDGIYHPGAPTIPAALALAQSLGASGEAFLRAVVVGYEIATRIGAAMGRAHYRYWHNTGTIGCFGSCAAAAELLGLDAKRFAHALATVTTFSAGLQQSFRQDSMSKPLHAGRAAEAGLTAALAAREGVIGSLDVIDGEAGYGRAMSDGPDWDKAVATLGKDFHITRMTFKNHTCCGHTFAAIDGALALQAKMGLKAQDIARVHVGTYKAALDVAGYEEPRTAAEGRFSLKYVVATALTHGSVRFAAFAPARLSDPATRELMHHIDVAVDPQLDAAFPAQRAARVAIEARDGRREEFLQPTRIGDPDAPLSDAQLDAKFLELAGPVLGDAAARAQLASLWKIDSRPTLRPGAGG